MANKKFTEEEMNHLRASPYVMNASTNIVHFSAKFKEMFWNSILEGKEPQDMLLSLASIRIFLEHVA